VQEGVRATALTDRAEFSRHGRVPTSIPSRSCNTRFSRIAAASLTVMTAAFFFINSTQSMPDALRVNEVRTRSKSRCPTKLKRCRAEGSDAQAERFTTSRIGSVVGDRSTGGCSGKVASGITKLVRLASTWARSAEASADPK
jgi:hypothetical protein